MSNSVCSTESLSLYEMWNSYGSYSRIKLVAFHELRRIENDEQAIIRSGFLFALLLSSYFFYFYFEIGI